LHQYLPSPDLYLGRSRENFIIIFTIQKIKGLSKKVESQLSMSLFLPAKPIRMNQLLHRQAQRAKKGTPLSEPNAIKVRENPFSKGFSP